MAYLLQAHIKQIPATGPLFNLEMIDLHEYAKCDTSNNRKQYWQHNYYSSAALLGMQNCNDII